MFRLPSILFNSVKRTSPISFNRSLSTQVGDVNSVVTPKIDFSAITSEISELQKVDEVKDQGLTQLGINEGLTDEERASMKRDPLLSLLVNLIMKNGEKSKSEKLVGKTLFLLRQRTLSDPYEVLKNAIDQASPLMKAATSKVGSKNVMVPKAITQRKRLRIGINWILEAANKRRNKSFPHKLTNEIVSVINEDSSVLAKKLELHKLILANRSNAILNR